METKFYSNFILMRRVLVMSLVKKIFVTTSNTPWEVQENIPNPWQGATRRTKRRLHPALLPGLGPQWMHS